jgi:hypothetical protein
VIIIGYVRHFYGVFLKVLAFILAGLAVLLCLPHFSPVIFPPVSEPSATFDCDDATLEMYRYFEDRGIESTPIIGNLHMDGEEYMECNHVWLLVKFGDLEIAYDWGAPRFDRQHYEGYTISLEYLLYAVGADRRGGNTMVAGDY